MGRVDDQRTVIARYGIINPTELHQRSTQVAVANCISGLYVD